MLRDRHFNEPLPPAYGFDPGKPPIAGRGSGVPAI